MKQETKKNKPEKISPAVKWIIIILAVIAITFIISYAYNKYQNKAEFDEQHKEYNYFTFEKDGIHWRTTWVSNNQPYNIKMRHWPGELEDIEITGSLNQMFNNSQNIYLTFNPVGENLDYVAVAAVELSLNINKALKRNIIISCLVNETADCEVRPIVTCDDNDKAVIYLKESEEPKVILSGNCMIIEGSKEDIVKSTERILYVWYGIMPR